MAIVCNAAAQNLNACHLAMLGVHVAAELEVVGEALGARALAHRHDAVLGGVEHLANLHRNERERGEE